MQPQMPLVRQRGQLEAGASLQPSTRLEATAAYSPLPHAVLAGAGTVAVRTGRENYLISRQAEVSLGGYWSLGPRLLLNTMAGGGTAYTDRQYAFWGTERRTGSYAKAFGQVGLALMGDFGSFNLSYRLAQVNYYAGVQTESGWVAPFQTQYHEVLLATRQALGFVPNCYLQPTVGLSVSTLRSPDDTSSQVDRDRWFAAGIPVPMASVGLVWQPGH